MVSLAELWLPILLSAVLVFIASSIVHMLLPIHRGDFKKLPGEDNVLDTVRNQNVAPGTYMFPCADSLKDAYTPEMIEKYKKGPVGFLTVIPSGPPNMVKSLFQWFIYSIIISIFVAYAAMLGASPGAEYMAVFRLTGTVAILGYAGGSVPESIWKGQSWTVTSKFIFDGIIYGLVTAGTFGWLWPEIAVQP